MSDLPDTPTPMPSPTALPAQFVYYRVPHANRHAAALAVQAMQAALTQQWPGLQATLMRRADATAHTEAAEDTWMETYAHPAGVSAALAQAIAAQASALPSSLIGVRHVETFEPLTLPLHPPLTTPTA
ncbi:uncharacterized protein DUF4936 [Aquabacterium commune]|uniref:Uncharacterized protein DUF4936 n=1 Tax=Aquabacterium commune TaxID=70586 RepID=A0A4R6RFC4_9BURK|nr:MULTISPECIES: DUF4936 family protein [Aquabacterium]MBT9610974.1 DUF4936 family protein [Aquabacterium sp.]TDP84487.1 uncharacterized protein DUF4936 [Aquabacterium commune]